MKFYAKRAGKANKRGPMKKHSLRGHDIESKDSLSFCWRGKIKHFGNMKQPLKILPSQIAIRWNPMASNGEHVWDWQVAQLPIRARKQGQSKVKRELLKISEISVE
jgi:hypothetical protein